MDRYENDKMFSKVFINLEQNLANKNLEYFEKDFYLTEEKVKEMYGQII